MEAMGPALQQLTSLTSLDMCPTDCMLSYEELGQLKELPRLSELHLSLLNVPETAFLEPLAQYMPGLPLCHLELTMFPGEVIPASVFSAVGVCMHLTSLLLKQYHHRYTSEGLLSLSAQMRHLSVLQSLHLLDGYARWHSMEPQEWSTPAWQALLESVAGLPSIRDFTVTSSPLGAVACRLCAATQLTRLELHKCNVGRDTCAALAASLSHLLPDDLVLDDGAGSD